MKPRPGPARSALVIMAVVVGVTFLTVLLVRIPLARVAAIHQHNSGVEPSMPGSAVAIPLGGGRAAEIGSQLVMAEAVYGLVDESVVSWDRFFWAQRTHDLEELAPLILAGKIFAVQPGTKLRLLDYDASRGGIQALLLTGDGAGIRVWIRLDDIDVR